MNRTLVFTGGGTAGHVTPNLALIERLRNNGWHCVYIGSKDSIEESLIEKESLPFYTIATGKLRRYFSWQNFLDPFKILLGIFQSIKHLLTIKPVLVFSKGGFVSFPVVFAAWLCRIPVIAHESDLTPGLTTKLTTPFVRYVCVTFEKGKQFFKNKQHVRVTGTPIRSALFSGDAEKAWELCHFNDNKPCILVIGGGLGSVAINKMVRESLDRLLPEFNIAHLCGKGKVEPSIVRKGYCQFEYVNEAMPDLYAMANYVISRSGANSVCEILSLEKPHIFIPLPLSASRGDQIHNAGFCKEQGLSIVLDEETLSVDVLCEAIHELAHDPDKYKQKMHALGFGSGTDNIIELIETVAG